MSGRTAWSKRVAANGIKMPTFALDKIRKPGASLDDLFPHIDWSADNDVYARLDDWSAVDKMFAHLGDLSTLDAILPADLMLDKLDGLFQPIDKPMGNRGGRRTSHR
jgi:hypothetical protein